MVNNKNQPLKPVVFTPENIASFYGLIEISDVILPKNEDVEQNNDD